jgi:hypothetical protein
MCAWLRPALLPRRGLQKVQMTDAQCFGELVNRNDSWITTPGLKTTDILLTESGKVAKLFLRQPLFEPNTPNVLADQFAHIHAQRKIDYII